MRYIFYLLQSFIRLITCLINLLECITINFIYSLTAGSLGETCSKDYGAPCRKKDPSICLDICKKNVGPNFVAACVGDITTYCSCTFNC